MVKKRYKKLLSLLMACLMLGSTFQAHAWSWKQWVAVSGIIAAAYYWLNGSFAHAAPVHNRPHISPITSTQKVEVRDYNPQRDGRKMNILQQAERTQLVPSDNIKNLRDFTQKLPSNDWDAYYAKVLYEHNNFAGYVVYRVSQGHGYSGPTGDIIQLVVKSGYRGKKYGNRLLQEAIRDMNTKEPQIYCIKLEVRSANAAAIHMYGREGFVYDAAESQGKEPWLVYEKTYQERLFRGF